MSKAKRNSLLLLLIGALFILILAVSLPNLVLSPGQPFSLMQSDSRTAIGPLPGGDVLLQLFRGFLALSLLLLPVYIVHSLVSKEGRRRLVANLILIVLLFLLADYLQRHPPFEALEPQPQEGEILGAESMLERLDSVLPAIFEPTPPSWLTLAVITIASILVVIVVFTMIGFLRKRAKSSNDALQKLSETAQNTLQSLQTGGNFEVTIIRCYQEMSHVVKTEKGLARQSTMTPREFEDELVSKGLPQEAVRTLTRLFEQVRYGRLPTSTHEEALAFSCLTDIVNACGGQA